MFRREIPSLLNSGKRNRREGQTHHAAKCLASVHVVVHGRDRHGIKFLQCTGKRFMNSAIPMKRKVCNSLETHRQVVCKQRLRTRKCRLWSLYIFPPTISKMGDKAYVLFSIKHNTGK